MNKVILMGRLTRDPDVRVSTGERQMSIARYTLAVDRRGRRSDNGEQTADFISCVAFDRNAEFADSKGAGSGDNGGFAPGSRPMPAAAAPADGFMNLPIGVEDEGLPFGN